MCLLYYLSLWQSIRVFTSKSGIPFPSRSAKRMSNLMEMDLLSHHNNKIFCHFLLNNCQITLLHQFYASIRQFELKPCRKRTENLPAQGECIFPRKGIWCTELHRCIRLHVRFNYTPTMHTGDQYWPRKCRSTEPKIWSHQQIVTHIRVVSRLWALMYLLLTTYVVISTVAVVTVK